MSRTVASSRPRPCANRSRPRISAAERSCWLTPSVLAPTGSRSTLVEGALRQRRTWTTKFELRTPRYTTQVDELPVAHA
ncbi:DUF4113 domain-containing protein [Methylorubrum extorquens]|uniref:DUF4113 domain-containing protein n=1 Tax=Methylorubrum extorquens TaxID=408 RepID=UPI0039C9CB7D